MIVRGAGLVGVHWRNGLGVTRDVVTRGTGAAGFGWQVSIADLERDCAFSHFPGCERVFTPLQGEVALAFGGGAFEDCPVLVPRRFSGEVATQCRVRAAGRAFNVVFDRGGCRAEVRVVRLRAGERVPAGTVVHCVAGALASSGGVLGVGDSLVDAGAVASLDAVAVVVAMG